MEAKIKTKILRKVIILTILVLGLFMVVIDNGVQVKAAPCDDAFNDYLNADNTYFNAFGLYHYNNPTSCAQDCSNSQNIPQCVADCEISRYTSLGEAQIGLQSLALDTCMPASPDECAQARARRDYCLLQFDPYSTQDPKELIRILTELPACIEASKVSSCE